MVEHGLLELIARSTFARHARTKTKNTTVGRGVVQRQQGDQEQITVLAPFVVESRCRQNRHIEKKQALHPEPWRDREPLNPTPDIAVELWTKWSAHRGKPLNVERSEGDPRRRKWATLARAVGAMRAECGF